MKLYKYRSLENFEYILDILLNERLYCAPYDKLNDPFEGVFLSVKYMGGFNTLSIGHTPLNSGKTVKTLMSISELSIPGGTRVCSLSASISDIRLWSHYANGHTGIAIEIEVDESNKQLHKVDYVDQLQEFGNTILTTPASTQILQVKSHHWLHENEYRLITDEEYYSVNEKITGIYLGPRTSPLMQEILMRSVSNAIPIFATKLNEKTIEVELNRQLNGNERLSLPS